MDDLAVGQFIKFNSIGVLLRIRIVDPINTIFCHEDGIRFDFSCTKGCCGVCREVWGPDSRTEDDDTIFFQMTKGPSTDVGFCHILHWNSGLYSRIHTILLQTVCHNKSIHDRTQHTSVVCLDTIHAGCSGWLSPPEIATTDN